MRALLLVPLLCGCVTIPGGPTPPIPAEIFEHGPPVYDRTVLLDVHLYRHALDYSPTPLEDESAGLLSRPVIERAVIRQLRESNLFAGFVTDASEPHDGVLRVDVVAGTYEATRNIGITLSIAFVGAIPFPFNTRWTAKCSLADSAGEIVRATQAESRTTTIFWLPLLPLSPLSPVGRNSAIARAIRGALLELDPEAPTVAELRAKQEEERRRRYGRAASKSSRERYQLASGSSC